MGVVLNGTGEKNALKAVSQTDDEMRVGNYIVLFGGRDLMGDYFTKGTDLTSNYTMLGTMYVDFEHGMDPDGLGNDQDQVIGLVDWKSAKVDDVGVYVQRILNRRADYMEFLSELIDAGVIGTSSACIPGKSLRSNDNEITKWPLMRDSLTVTPMEPRMLDQNVLAASKSLARVFPHSKSLAALAEIAPGKRRIKSIDDVEDFTGMERYLRQAGLAKPEAKAVVHRMKSMAGGRKAPLGDLDELMAATMAALSPAISMLHP